MGLKRGFDVAMSGLALLALTPLFVLIAVAIKLSSSGALFYVAPRAGRGNRKFGQLKFRTMHRNADRAGAFTAKNDTRIFAAGKVLRMLKLDELPQLLNVWRGEMSIVGPRPEDWDTVQTCYTAEQMRVLEATPGLTGLPQVRFFPDLSIIDTKGMDSQLHYKTVILPMRLQLDLEYIDKRSFLYDLGLIARTVYLIAVRAPWILITGRVPRVELAA